MTNIRHFSKAYAIAAASPSISAYLLSASIQNLLPANIRCHPSGQQTGALSVVQEQCFCNRSKPIPSLFQSGARQVMRFFSNVAMPFRTRSTMTRLECWNAALMFYRCVFGVAIDVNEVEGVSAEGVLWVTGEGGAGFFDLVAILSLGASAFGGSSPFFLLSE